MPVLCFWYSRILSTFRHPTRRHNKRWLRQRIPRWPRLLGLYDYAGLGKHFVSAITWVLHFVSANLEIQITTTMNTIISKIVLMFFEKRCSFVKTEKLYLSCGFFNCASLILTNKSLQYVSYPVQVLGKACRPIPVIIFSALIAKKFHSLQKWIGRDSLFSKLCH